MMNYAQQIKHPKWQKKRLEVLKLHKFTCQVCGEKEEELHVHHPVYKRGAMIWEYDKGELECLCHRCHKDAHAIDEQIKKALASCKEKEKVLAYIVSLNKAKPSPAPKKIIKAVKETPDYDREHEAVRKERVDRIDRETAEIYREYPDLVPLPTDTAQMSSDKFFKLMRLMTGN